MATISGVESLRALENSSKAKSNLAVAQLMESALQRGEGCLASDGALVAVTGERTGRSPKDKFIVDDPVTHDLVHWGKINQAITPERFEALLERVTDYLSTRELFVEDLDCGADPAFRLPIRVIAEYAWQALFARQMLLRPKTADLATHAPEFTVIATPGFEAVPERDGTASGAFILTDFTRRIVLIGGTRYAGEIKKSIFGVMNFLVPQRDVLPMHCSANVGADGGTALFFGLSGTGKTTLSADPARRLIGDDEHGWSPAGVFNFEGGCYAKCVKLTEATEPEIFRAIRFGAVLENVILDPVTRKPDFADTRLTENTRVAYPVDYIENALLSGVGGHPRNVMFLTADAFGVLPPIAKLTPEQAMYHFLSGYTAKLAGTEAGLGSDPVPDFSACFGAPFMPLAPHVYAEMLGERLRKHKATCWLVNTGWSGGKFGVGKRMSLKITRALVDAALEGRLDQVEFISEPAFGLSIPVSCPGVPAEILHPRSSWADKAAYDRQAIDLAARFDANFQTLGAPEAIRAAGPKAR